MQMQLPGYAVLARVAFPRPTPDGDGCLCAFAVRTPSIDAAWTRVRSHLLAEFEGAEVTLEDTRTLADNEAPAHATLHPLGGMVYFGDGSGNRH